MKIAIAYTCVSNGKLTLHYSSRFAASYHEFPPGAEHDTIIVSNGGPAAADVSVSLSSLPCLLFPRSNEGWDIGGYIAVSRGPGNDYDLLVCLGESVYFHRAGWLARIVECWQQYGPGMYGLFSSNVLRPHLNTTAFATSPDFLRRYGHKVVDRKDRYNFEHGERSFWKWLTLCAKPVRLVTWDGCWSPNEWRTPSNILWRGDQSNCLAWCNHSDNYLKMTPYARDYWTRQADRAFA